MCVRERQIDETLFSQQHAPYRARRRQQCESRLVRWCFFIPPSRSPLQYANESFRVGATVRSWGVAGVVRI